MAVEQIATMEGNQEYSVEEFTYEMYDASREWHKKAGIILFINLK